MTDTWHTELTQDGDRWSFTLTQNGIWHTAMGGYRSRAAALDAGGFLSCCPERDMKPLYASPAVPVGSGEPVARATCQDCGGHIEGWICQSCDRQFRENDAGDLVFEDQPVFPVGVSREEIARIIDPWAFSVVGNIMHTERASEDRDKALAKADAILAALRPADTGANHD